MEEADLRLVLEALGAFRSDYEATSALPPKKLKRLVRLTADLEGQLAGAHEFGPGEPVRYPDVRVSRAVLRNGNTAVLLSVVLGAMRGRAVSLPDLREFRQAMFDAGSYERALRLAERTVTFE